MKRDDESLLKEKSKLMEALMRLEIYDHWRAGYWSAYIDGMLAVDPTLEPYLPIWNCLDHGKMHAVSYHSDSGPGCPKCCSPVRLVDNPATEPCCRRMHDYLNEREERYKTLFRNNHGRYYIDKGAISITIEHCPFCGKKFPEPEGERRP